MTHRLSISKTSDPASPSMTHNPPLSPKAKDHSELEGGNLGFSNVRKRIQKTTATGDSEWFDEERANMRSYEYLCHVGEAKEWIEACIKEDIGQITQIDENLRNGVILAKLARFFEPTCVKKIFEDPKLQFRHSDNTNFFFAACRKAGLPDIFIFELTDVYDKKNIPKVIYCLHALSYYLSKRGIAPKIKNLVGQLEFSPEDLLNMENSLKEAGVTLPQFGNIEANLQKELNEPDYTWYEQHEKEVIACQSFIKMRKQRVAYLKMINEAIPRIVKVQALARRWYAQLQYKKLKFVIKLQAHVRGFLFRKRPKLKKMDWVKFEALCRGRLRRDQYKELMNRLNNPDNIKKLTRLQALVRAHNASRAYKSLASPQQMPASTVHSYYHLLDDNEKDFLEEQELERIKQQVAKKIRESNQLEQFLNDLDIKIALLVRNRITLDEVLKMSKTTRKEVLTNASQLNLSQSSDNLFSSANIKSLDKESRARLESYQNLFYVLQTQPQYLVRAIFTVKQTKIRSFMDHVLLTLYNYANSSREEFLLLKFFQRAIVEEMKSVTELADFMKGNPIFIKMVVHYYRGAKERQFLRELLQPLVKEVIGNNELDLETDPINIYRQLIKEEESKTGEKSQKPYDIGRQEALKDPETKKIFDDHLEKLKQATDKFLEAIFNHTNKMPFGIRYLASQLKQELQKKFVPQNKKDEEQILKVIGNLVYYRYMNPAIVAPEGFDVIEQLISPLQRKNLAEISKLLQQVSACKSFDSEQSYLSPLNQYVQQAGNKMLDYFQECTNVPAAEEHFQMSDYTDLVRTHKPVIYITPQEIFNTHQLIIDTLEEIAPDQNDLFRTLLKDLPPPPSNSVTVIYSQNHKKQLQDQEEKPANERQSNEISLSLSSRLMDQLAASALGSAGGELVTTYRNLFNETKRLVSLMIRVQNGRTVAEILKRTVQQRNENVYQHALQEMKKKQSHQQPQQQESVTDTPQLERKQQAEVHYPNTFQQLKDLISKNIKQLEDQYPLLAQNIADPLKQQQLGIYKVSIENQYQDFLTAIGSDIRNKHQRRQQRRMEIGNMQKTIVNLDDKMKYLEEQRQSYQDYIQSCMAQLTSKKREGKESRFVMPFGSQWQHQQSLKKEGKIPQFGSYKYTADVLYKKGVLVSIEGQSTKNFGNISLVISSDETGIFQIETYFLGIKHQKMELKLEELLQAQFENQTVIGLFDGAAKVNVNLLLFLINKKFYK